MKRIALLAVVLLMASSVWAGANYQFSSITDGPAGSIVAGTAWVQSGNMRIDFTSGDGIVFKTGSTIIAKGGGKSLFLLDPEKKAYFELDIEQLFASAMAMMKSAGGEISIENQRVNVTNAGGGDAIEGYPTKRYVVDSAYDLHLKMMGMEINSSTQTSTQVWATDSLSSDYATFLQQRAFKTGVAEFDKLVDSQLGVIEGFPLKQVMKSKTTTRGRTLESTTTVTISNVKELDVPGAKFAIPDGYKKIDQPVPQMPTPR